PEAFDPSLIRLADIDGSGTVDIIYLGRSKFACWMNLGGNSLSLSPFEADPFPEVHDAAHVTVADLLGNGVSCIVWSGSLPRHGGAALRYIDLMDGRKPHVMILSRNNMGREVRLEYQPSTRYYLEDRLADRPWATKLHFPVHCVSKTETRDLVTGTLFSTSYKYHHGYYDHAEREFRGFGMVEQTDTEEFEHWERSGASNIVSKTLHQPPMLTRSWFHTGAFTDQETILDQFATEYWHEEMKRRGFAASFAEPLLPPSRVEAAPGLDPSLVSRLSAGEWREALRACKGMPLRTEVFALDAPDAAEGSEELKTQLTPYSVSTHSCRIELLQPRGGNRHAVFAVLESEAVRFHYERKPEDPRMAHTLNISVDQWGNVLESASVVYPRKLADPLLPQETRDAQARTHITFIKNSFTNDITGNDRFRLRRLSETMTYELKGVGKTGELYSVDEFTGILNTATEVAYYQVDAVPSQGAAQKRLVEHVRYLFYNDGLTGPLPLHQLSPQALPYESYQLAFTPALLSDIFGGKVDDALMAEGKFVHSEGDSNWWVRSGAVQYLYGGETSADARSRFFMPVSYTDPFGAVTKVKYYPGIFLFIEETEDALQNRTKVLRFNFRTLAPQQMMDANDNISEALADELGLVKAMAVMGKGSEADELSGLEEFTTPAEEAQVNAFISSAVSTDLMARGRDLLRHASVRFVYDLHRFRASGGKMPCFVAAITREEHFKANANSPLLLSFEYTGGFNQVVMKKAQAPPGPAKKLTVNPDLSYTVSPTDTSASRPQQLRWVGSGRVVMNNKGKPVMQYEPYFSVTHEYEDQKELVETGVTPIYHYDPVGRMVKTELPDGSFSRSEFGAWKQSVYDRNDTAADSEWYHKRFNRLIDAELAAAGKDPAREKIAAEKAALHAGTPATQHLDTLGRVVLMADHNGKDGQGQDQVFLTRTELDIEGNLRSVTDARNNKLLVQKFDLLGNKVYQETADAGERWLLLNIIGSGLRTWDGRGHQFAFGYDILHRPTSKKVIGGDGPAPLDHVYELTVYGEGLPNDKASNFRTKPVTVYDTAGRVATAAFDFKGNPVSATRRFAADYKEIPDWSGADPNNGLEAEEHATLFTYDALNRVRSHSVPGNHTVKPHYNEAGMLHKVQLTGSGVDEWHVSGITYNEKGQREKITYGNGVNTTYFYDRETFRLVRLLTRKQNGDLLQDLNYTFDPVGNITHVEDRNIPEVFFNNQKITGVSSYTYDPLYRLVEATGREHAAQAAFGAE
ncbi:MAG TPA: toxin TcdB middle/C-terminal domain-containing protein, partial [Flavisolibacter sp.]